MTDGPMFDFEEVHCCMCNGSGRVSKPRLFNRKRTVECLVCEGKGQREIIIARNLSDADKQMVRASAITGSLNMFPPARPSLGDIFGISGRDITGSLFR